jgi:septal ring factor EnvC (AmiA/AmiB activator)
MKKKPAIIAAFITTLVIAVAMLLMGMNAIYNPNTVPVSNAPATVDPAINAASAANIAPVSANTSDTVQQLQNLISQYQQRDQQYQQQVQTLQSQLQQVQTQLNQANSASAQYQSLLSQLQTRGIITIDSSGNVFVSRRGTDH